jgi:hypothetical protein
MEGMRLLCLHYRIPWEMNEKPRFILLAFALARDHVPYFRQRKYRNDMKWTLALKDELINKVNGARWKTRGERPLRCYRLGFVPYACNWLVLNDSLYSQYDPTSLEARYKTAIKTPSLKGWESRAKHQGTGDDVSDSRKAAPAGANKKIKDMRKTR